MQIQNWNHELRTAVERRCAELSGNTAGPILRQAATAADGLPVYCDLGACLVIQKTGRVVMLDLDSEFAISRMKTGCWSRFPHFRGAVAAAAAAAWKEREQGASDAVMWAAARKVIVGYYEKLLSTADEPNVRSYLQIRLDQLRAARNVSDEACAQQANSSLDISQALSRDLYERELTWVRAAIGRMNQPPAPPVDTLQFNLLMLRLEERLGSDVVATARNPAAHADQPEQLCQASLQFYEAVRALPMSERILATRGLFQGVAQ